VAPPELVRANVPAALIPALFPTLPSAIKTQQDFLNLPWLGASVGIGDPSQPPPYNVDQAKTQNRYHFFVQDTWRIKPRLTLNYGLGWSFESTLVNRDLDKPKYLAPIYGSDLGATNNNYNNFSPALGFAYQLDKSAKTVLRGGFGIYWDTDSLYKRLQERASTGPIGNGRVLVSADAFKNIFPGILDFSLGGVPVAVGAPLPNGHLSNLTLGQYIQIQNAQAPAIAAALAPKNLNDLSVRNIQISKTGSQLYPKDFPVQHSLQFTIGVQRQLKSDMVLNVDFVRRVFLNTNLGELDGNRWNRYINGVRSPVIPACVGSQAADPNAQCSSGPITFWYPGGRQVYNAMLVKLDKRFAHRYQFTASYALTDQHGYNSIYNLDKLNASWGPQGGRHILNVSGIVDLPWGFNLGIIATAGSRGPVTPTISGVDLTGSGITTTPLPGLDINCMNRGCGSADLEKAVANWNTNYAGKKDALGKTIPAVVLPQKYRLGDNTTSEDIRLTKVFSFGGEPHVYKLSIFGEAFNIFNVANLGYTCCSLDQVQSSNQTFQFGQPNSRAGQVFGSGGPRAFQVGARFQF